MTHYLRGRDVFYFCEKRVKVTRNFLGEDVILAIGVFMAFLMTYINQITLSIEFSSSTMIPAKPFLPQITNSL